MILSDISKRVIIVEGEEEKDRIMNSQKPNLRELYSIRAEEIGNDIWKVELIYAVGSYYNK